MSASGSQSAMVISSLPFVVLRPKNRESLFSTSANSIGSQRVSVLIIVCLPFSAARGCLPRPVRRLPGMQQAYDFILEPMMRGCLVNYVAFFQPGLDLREFQVA